MNRKKGLFPVLFAIFTSAVPADAQTRFAVRQELPQKFTICSQNLKNYALVKRKDSETKSDADEPSDKEDALVSRFIETGCDAVGVQEVNGANDEAAKSALRRLALFWKKKTGRPFDVQVGSANQNNQRVGIIVALDKAEILNVVSYRQVLLPKIDDNQKPRQFSRSPIEVQLSLKASGDDSPRTISIIVFHFKSKSGSMGDPAGLEWETVRMEMSEGLRRIVEDRYKRTLETGDVPLVLIGDRNSNFDSASALILEGALTLQDFKGKAPCRLSKRGVPLCQAETTKPAELFSVLTGDPQTKRLPGTFVYKKTYSWIDDILMPQSVLGLARTEPETEGDYDSGVVSDHPDASDHALVYVRINR